jgi:hypothetical protein
VTAQPAPVYFLCDCAACARRYAVLTVPATGTQLWYDRRYYPRDTEATVSGDGYHCPWCGARLAGTPGVLVNENEWVPIVTLDLAGLN